MRGKGRSLHVGVNSPYPGSIKDGLPVLRGCDNAARAMANLVRQRGVSPETRVRREETRRSDVEAWFAQAADQAEPGDLVVFTFAGHGIIVRDGDGEPDGGRALVCSDDVLVTDRIHEMLANFGPGVRVVVVAEACYSGTIASRTVEADVLLMAAADRRSKAPGAAPGQHLPPFTQKLVDAWNRGRGNFAGGYEGWTRSAGTLPPTTLPARHKTFALEQPFSV
jgi:metacaspase-1